MGSIHTIVDSAFGTGAFKLVSKKRNPGATQVVNKLPIKTFHEETGLEEICKELVRQGKPFGKLSPRAIVEAMKRERGIKLIRFDGDLKTFMVVRAMCRQLGSHSNLLQECRKADSPLDPLYREFEGIFPEVINIHTKVFHQALDKSFRDAIFPSLLPADTHFAVKRALMESNISGKKLSLIAKDKLEAMSILYEILYQSEPAIAAVHLGHLYASLPGSIREVVSKINLPAAVYKTLREVTATLHYETSPEWKKLMREADGENRYLYLLERLYRHAPELGSIHLGQLYTGLPYRVRRHTHGIEATAKQYQAVKRVLFEVDLGKDPQRNDDPESYFTEIYQKMLKSAPHVIGRMNVGHLYRMLPFRVKQHCRKVDLPAARFKELLALLEKPPIELWDILELDDADLRSREFFSYMKKQKGFKTCHPQNIRSGLPRKIKEKIHLEVGGINCTLH